MAEPPLSAPRRIRDYLIEVIERESIQTLVIDITTMSTQVSLSLCQWFGLSEQRPYQIQDVIVAYTKPANYQANLGGGFQPPHTIDGFAVKDIDNEQKDEREIGWIPVLGFSAMPTLMAKEFVLRRVQEQHPLIDSEVASDALINERTYPVLGWPPYRPDFYNRALWENREILQAIKTPLDRLRYSSAADPFEAAQCVEDIVLQRSDLRFICSAQGSQPMNLGCALACATRNTELLHSFSATSFPNLLHGDPGETFAYWIFSRTK